MAYPQSVPRVKPGGAAFLIPVAIFVLGIIIGIVFIVWGVGRGDQIVEDFARVPVGESATFTFEEGSYRIWLEGEDVGDSSEFVEGNIVATDGGEQLTTEDFVGTLTYDIGGREGVAFMTFDLSEAGEYEVTFDSVSSERSDRNLAIGQDNPVTAIGLGIGVGIAVMALGFVIAVVVLIVVLIKRSNSRRAARAAASPPPSWGGGYGPPTAGYPPQPYPPAQPYPPPPDQYPPPQA